MATALVIGLGTSGLHIIEECQQFHYQFTGQNKPDSVKYLYFETDINQKSSTTALGKTAIDPVYLSLQNIGAKVNQLLGDSRLDHSWIPPVDTALAASTGAGGQSAYGRLSLWMNYSAVREAILNSWQKIHGDQFTYIFIVGTLTGGTGSGTCVDMAYLVRDITNSSNVFGLFLTPSRQQLSKNGTDALFYNYFSAISTIKHFTNENHPFDVVWPDGSKYHTNVSPYKQCYFLSQDYTNNFAPISSIAELYKVAGLHLFSRIHSFGKVDQQTGGSLPNFTELIDRRLLDIASNVPSWRFSTFGTKLIYYPKELLKEVFGIRLSKSILEQWTDSINYIDKNQDRVAIVARQQQIKGLTKQAFNSLIVECLNVVDGQNTANGTNLLKEIENVNVNAIITKNFQAPNVNAYIYRLFTADNASNHFALVSNNRLTIRDQFIQRIYDLLVSQLDTYQNLNVAKLILEAIAESIEETLSFWKKEYNLDGQQSNWNRVLQTNINSIMSAVLVPKLLLQQKAYLYEQLVNLLMLSKMQLSVDILTDIKSSLTTGLPNISSQKYQLPSIPQVSKLIALVNNVIANSGSNDSEVTLQRRENEIKSNLTTNTPNFAAIFSKGSMEKDLEHIDSSYRNSKQNNRFLSKEITNNVSIWPYLEKTESQRLYFDCLTRSMIYVNNSLSEIYSGTINDLITQLQNNPADNQWQAIKQFIINNEGNIREALPGLVELRANTDIFLNHACLKLTYLNGDIAALSPIIKNYNINNLDASCELAGFNEAIIIYQEYGYMGDNNPPFDPVLNIGINSTVSQRIASNIDINSEEVTSPNVFVFKRRVPYLSLEQFKSYLKL